MHLVSLLPSHHLHISVSIITNSVISWPDCGPHANWILNETWATLHFIPLMSQVMPPLLRWLRLAKTSKRTWRSSDLAVSNLFSSTCDRGASNAHITSCCGCICQRNTLARLCARVKQQSHSLQWHRAAKGVISPQHNSGANLRGN